MKKDGIDKLMEIVSKRKAIHMTDIRGKKKTPKVGKFVLYKASEDSDKVFILQEVEPLRKKHLGLIRLGYYIIGNKPKKRGRWVWGQFCPFITPQ